MEKKIKKLSDFYSNKVINAQELLTGGAMHKVRGCGCMVVGGQEDEGKGAPTNAEKYQAMYEKLCELEGEG